MAPEYAMLVSRVRRSCITTIGFVLKVTEQYPVVLKVTVNIIAPIIINILWDLGSQ